MTNIDSVTKVTKKKRKRVGRYQPLYIYQDANLPI